ncbi:MAG: hypothetical protein KKG47_03735 [Proteobacteria bacterium]|nr:hypothetical protein [Pseudomonadota bacterium]MBU1738915.1 hypothetical protein [Pseudomonadota bacterium]
MAEIKSTMDMVLERAARMAGEHEGEGVSGDDILKEGMRAGAAFMRGEESSLGGLVAARPEKERVDFLKGAAKSLLRNIILPRDEEQLKNAELAMNGLVQLSQGNRDLLAVFGDLKKILDQYMQHRVQAKEQLEAAFAQQMAQMEGALAKQTGRSMKLKPNQHPKFNEEWQRVLNELNSQYGRAVDQHKQLVENFLSGQG